MKISTYYGDVVYNKVFNESFYKKLESVQYNDVLPMTFASGKLILRKFIKN